mgnify:CR=1 FL=1
MKLTKAKLNKIILYRTIAAMRFNNATIELMELDKIAEKYIISCNARPAFKGYNGFPRGIVDAHSRLLDKETKYKYIVHAEMNCIYNAAYQGSCLVGSTMYVHGLPVCHECAKGIIQSGIIRVVSPKIKEPTVIAMKWKQSMKLTMDLFTEVGIRYDFV